jgi:hypothetical protein
MNKKAFILLYSLTLMASSCKSPDFITDETGWVLLGERKVNHLVEKDVFRIKSRDRFTALRLYVKDRDVEIRSVEIMLVNGDILKPSIGSTIQQGERSRMIDLGAEGRQLESVTVKYSADGKIFSRKGKVQLGGRPHQS